MNTADTTIFYEIDFRRVTPDVEKQIIRSLRYDGREHGGMLGSSRPGIVDRFYRYTDNGTAESHTPCGETMLSVVRRWADEKVRFVGFVHSRPQDSALPSRRDDAYAEAFLMDHADYRNGLLMYILSSGRVHKYACCLDRAV